VRARVHVGVGAHIHGSVCTFVHVGVVGVHVLHQQDHSAPFYLSTYTRVCVHVFVSLCMCACVHACRCGFGCVHIQLVKALYTYTLYVYMCESTHIGMGWSTHGLENGSFYKWGKETGCVRV